jgi:hypothetical protein
LPLDAVVTVRHDHLQQHPVVRDPPIEAFPIRMPSVAVDEVGLLDDGPHQVFETDHVVVVVEHVPPDVRNERDDPPAAIPR